MGLNILVGVLFGVTVYADCEFKASSQHIE